jgi:serine protease Do
VKGAIMPNKEQTNQNDSMQNEFIIEKMKHRPLNGRKLVRKTFITGAMAIVFGLVACVTFLLLQPIVQDMLYPKKTPQLVVFPDNQEEMSPADMLPGDEDTNEIDPDVLEEIMKEEQIEEILSEIVLDKTHYGEMYQSMAQYIKELRSRIVTVTSVESQVDWLNVLQENKNQAHGAIIANNGVELLILAEVSALDIQEELLVTFDNGAVVKSRIKMIDSLSQLAILSIEMEDIAQIMPDYTIARAPLGRTSASALMGTPVIAVGNPMGTGSSAGYGMITSSGETVSGIDRQYKLLMTDIMGSPKGSGILFNLSGEVVGILTSYRIDPDMKNHVHAYSVAEIKNIIQKMSNASPMASLGIIGQDVTREAYVAGGVPYGAFITEVAMDSPAMLAGMQPGDVIIQINRSIIASYGEYVDALMNVKPAEAMEIRVMRQSQGAYKEMKFTLTAG